MQLVFVPMTVDFYLLMTEGPVAALQFEAHFVMAEKNFPTPVSLGFSRPRIARCFITLMNSLLESFLKHFSLSTTTIHIEY